MTIKKKHGIFDDLRYDLPAGLVVFLVALPLCLGIALASGAPLFSGIIAGIIGGTVVSMTSGSALGVSGPAAGLAVIVLSSIQELGSFEVFLMTVVLAGLIQIILGFLKAGVIGYYFPSSVIKGMLSSIGIIIILKQIPHAFGYDKDPEGDLAFNQVDGHTTFSELEYMMDSINQGAIVISLVSLFIMILWERDFIKKNRILGLVQGPLLAVLVSILLNKFFLSSGRFLIGEEHMVKLPVAGSLNGFFSQFSLPDFSQWNNGRIYVIALTLAVIGSLETLLSVEAIDKLDPQKRITPTNRELLAQGLGNTISGFIGGLPITQVIVRSSANVQAGGRTKLSGFLHGILLLVCVMFIPGILNMIPLACLASILFMVGFKLAKPSQFMDVYRKGFEQFVPFIVTVVGIIFTDLLIGIGMGMTVAILNILWNNYKTPFHFNPDDYIEGKVVKIELSEDVTFLNKASIMQTLSHMPDGAHIIIDGSKAKNIHPDVIEIIDDFSQNALSRDIKLELLGLEKKSSHDSMSLLTERLYRRKNKN